MLFALQQLGLYSDSISNDMALTYRKLDFHIEGEADK